MLWNRAIIQIKVQWKHFSPKEATWEMEDKMREAYPSMFQNEQERSEQKNTKDSVKNKGGRNVIPPIHYYFI